MRLPLITTTTQPFTNTTPVVFRNQDILPSGLEATLKVLYVVVALLGLFGNGFVFYLFGSKKIRLTPFKILILNVAISDALAATSLWPYIFIDLRTLRQFSQETSNILCAFTMGQMPYWTATVASIFTLCGISITRYLFIRHPFKARLFNKTHALIIIGLSWPLSLSITVPNLLSFKYNAEYAICEREWPSHFNGQVYSSITSLMGFVIPSAVMIFTFVELQRYFWKTNATGISQSQRATERRKSAERSLAALIIVYFACWSPFFIYWVLSRTAKKIFTAGPEGEYERMRVLRFVILISLCNTVVNPIIYAIKMEDFKKSFQEVLDKMPFCKGKCCSFARSRATTFNESDCEEHRIPLQQL